MKLKLFTCCTFATAIAICSLAAECQAQVDHRPAFRLFRWMGQGYSSGYHECNPGPDTSYYSPYSRANTPWTANPWKPTMRQAPARLDRYIDPSFHASPPDMTRRPVYQPGHLQPQHPDFSNRRSSNGSTSNYEAAGHPMSGGNFQFDPKETGRGNNALLNPSQRRWPNDLRNGR